MMTRVVENTLWWLRTRRRQIALLLLVYAGCFAVIGYYNYLDNLATMRFLAACDLVQACDVVSYDATKSCGPKPAAAVPDYRTCWRRFLSEKHNGTTSQFDEIEMAAFRGYRARHNLRVAKAIWIVLSPSGDDYVAFALAGSRSNIYGLLAFSPSAKETVYIAPITNDEDVMSLCEETVAQYAWRRPLSPDISTWTKQCAVEYDPEPPGGLLHIGKPTVTLVHKK